MPKITVHRGDCIASIAAAQGFRADTLWNHGENSALKALRSNPMVLHPGDEVFIPEREEKQVEKPAGAQHCFVFKAMPPTRLEVQLLDFLGEPRANMPCIVDIDGELREGRSTDGDGFLREPISPLARTARIRFTGEDLPPWDEEWLEIDLGHVDPIDTVQGVQQRLLNLGAPSQAVTGEMDERTQRSLRWLQRRHGLPVTGEADGATQAKLLELHGC